MAINLMASSQNTPLSLASSISSFFSSLLAPCATQEEFFEHLPWSKARPDNFWDYVVPPLSDHYTGVHGTARARAAAKKETDLSGLKGALEKVFPGTQGLDNGSWEDCKCRIVVPGRVVCTDCPVHEKFADLKAEDLPLNRWCDESIRRISGGCHLHLFSGWAAPSVLALAPRWSTTGRVLSVIGRTARVFRHHTMKFWPSKSVMEDGTFVLHLEPSHIGFNIMSVLRAAPPDTLIGGEQQKQALPTISQNANPIEALGGVREVMTGLIAPHISPGFSRTWSPDLLPSQMVDYPTSWVRGLTSRHRNTAPGEIRKSIASKRISSFVRHFPQNLAIPRLPQHFDEDLISHWAIAQDNLDDLFVPCNYTRHFQPSPPEREALDAFNVIIDVLRGDLTSQSRIKEADEVGAHVRAMGSRGQRLIPGWEANLIPRWQTFRQCYASWSQQTSYTEMAYRLSARYLASVVKQEMERTDPANISFHVDNTACGIELIHIGSTPPALAPPAPGGQPLPVQNGEAPMWDTASQTDLLTGRAQFLDVQGMDREMIALLVSALAPQARDQTPTLRVDGGVPNAPNPDNNRDYCLMLLRNTYANGVRRIFLHHGSSPLPTAADQQWILDNAFTHRSSAMYGSAIRALCMRHDLPVFLACFDSLLYRGVGYLASDMPGVHDRAGREVILSGGNLSLYLPKPNTASGYFDAFYVPVNVPTQIETILRSSSAMLTHTMALTSHFRAVSLNWASKVTNMLGMQWQQYVNPLLANQYLRNHGDKWLRVYYSDVLNLWSAMTANAMGTQYGFSPSPFARSTEENLIVPWWDARCAPYMANHYLEIWAMQTIPTFQVLPYYDPEAETSKVRWPQGSPAPVESLTGFTDWVKLARELPAYPGLSWLGDGGGEYNGQHFAAQGNNGQFRYQGGVPKHSLEWWDAEFIHSRPMAPNRYQPPHMAPFNTPFADFILPGSVFSYRMRENRTVNWGVTVRDRGAAPLTHIEKLRWWQASTGVPHQSLMINVVRPSRVHVELDSLNNYAVTIWEVGSRFAGMTFADIGQQIYDAQRGIGRVAPAQTPFIPIVDSAPTNFSQPQPARVTAGRERTSSKVSALRSLLSARGPQMPRKHASYDEDEDTLGQVEYTSPYPNLSSELPDEAKGSLGGVETDGGQVRRSASAPSAAVDDKSESNDVGDTSTELLNRVNRPLDPNILDKINYFNRLQAQLDDDFSKYLAECRRVKMNRVSNTKSSSTFSQPNHWAPKGQGRSPPSPGTHKSPGQASKSATMSGAISGSPPIKRGNIQGSDPNNVLPRGPVVVNDDSAAEAQRQAELIQKAQATLANLEREKAQMRGGSRRPSPPPSSQKKTGSEASKKEVRFAEPRDYDHMQASVEEVSDEGDFAPEQPHDSAAQIRPPPIGGIDLSDLPDDATPEQAYNKLTDQIANNYRRSANTPKN